MSDHISESPLGQTRVPEAQPPPPASSTMPPQSTHITPPRRRRRWPWVVVFVLLIIAAGIMFQQHRRKAAEQQSNASPGQRGPGGRGPGGPQTIMVATATAQKGDIGVYVSALGVVTPLSTVAIRSRVDGQLVTVHYTEGQLVEQGAPLIDIDPAPFQAALSQAEGQLARDTALLENARLDVERYKEAFAKNAIPRQLLDTQASTLRQYEGAVKVDQAQVENARVQLAYCHITAPVSGRVGLRLVDAGNIVRANDTNPLVVITQIKPISVIFSVAEDYLPQIQREMRQGRKLEVDAFDRAQQKKISSGTLQTLDNQIDTTTGTIKLKSLFANDDESLFPNQFVNARLLVETHKEVTLVPNPAIQRNAQGAFVYLIGQDQTATVHAVTLGTTDGNVTEVGGLEPGAVVAADNFNRLTDGAKVMIRGSGPPGGPRRPGAARQAPTGEHQGQRDARPSSPEKATAGSTNRQTRGARRSADTN